LMKAGLIKAAAHITGGGITGNLPRVLGNVEANKTYLRFQVDCCLWDIPHVISWFAQLGNVKAEDCLNTWNCGLGMILVVSEQDYKQVIDKVKEAKVIGRVFETKSVSTQFVEFLNSEHVVKSLLL